MGEATHLGTFLRECRMGLKYTSRQVARLSGERKDLPSISNSYLISVENGKHIPRLDKVIALAEVLNVPVLQLIDRCRLDLGAPDAAPEATEFQALLKSGRDHAALDDHAGALRDFRTAYQIVVDHRDQGGIDPRDVQELRLQIANCYRRLKINRVAKEELESFLKLRDLEPAQRARGAFALADIYREEGSTFLGTILAREALELARQTGDVALEGKILSSLGNLAAEEGRSEEALSHYRDASVKLRTTGQERSSRLARTKIGLILIERRDFFRAIELLRAELSECREADPYTRGWLHLGLAKAYHGAENLRSTATHARSARECADRVDAPDLKFLAHFYLWLVARQERSDQAANHLERLLHYRGRLDTELEEVKLFDRLRAAVPQAPPAAPQRERGVSR